MSSENHKEQFYCPKCKLFFIVNEDPEKEKFEDIEIDDSEFEYGGD